MAYPIFWVPSPKYTAGHPAPLIAIVHHRMVGSLASTDVTFTTGSRVASTNFGVGYACGKAGHPAGVHIHQYVRLGDQAWGNGNWDASGAWNDRYPTSSLNSRTISIEHHDNGGAPLGRGKGVVPESVQQASIWLDILMKSGDLSKMKGAGIRFNPNYETAIARELKAMPVDGNHIIDHNYIAGRLKPYCWKPWSDDKVGFPKAKYIAAIRAGLSNPVTPPPPPPPPEEEVESFNIFENKEIALPLNSVLYISSTKARGTTEDARSDSQNIVITAEPLPRVLPLVGEFGDGVRVVAYKRPEWSVPHSYYTRPGVGTVRDSQEPISDAELQAKYDAALREVASLKTAATEQSLLNQKKDQAKEAFDQAYPV